jgi:hypothetical protein
MNITEEKMKKIYTLLEKNDVYYSSLSYGEEKEYKNRMDALYIDGDMSFDLMEEILQIVKS